MGFITSEHLDQYVEEHTTPQPAVLHGLERETYLSFSLPQMLSGKVQGRFLEMISHMIKPERVLEIGTFTGYSAICLARGMKSTGLLTTIDSNEELEDIIREHIALAGMEDRIELFIGEAAGIISGLRTEFDLVFIDADKVNYSLYYDLVFPKLRKGGFILADNVLWSGKVVEGKGDKDTQALIAFSDKVQNDDRVENVLLTVRDGIMMVRKIKD